MLTILNLPADYQEGPRCLDRPDRAEGGASHSEAEGTGKRAAFSQDAIWAIAGRAKENHSTSYNGINMAYLRLIRAYADTGVLQQRPQLETQQVRSADATPESITGLIDDGGAWPNSGGEAALVYVG